jgi:hypothetical protein
MKPRYSAGDRLLFWISCNTGISIDKIYASRFVRMAMILADKFEGRPSRDPL